MLNFCSNTKLENIGDHILGVYPNECSVCHEYNLTQRKNKPRYFIGTKPILRANHKQEPRYKQIISSETKAKDFVQQTRKGITGFDVWPDPKDHEAFNNLYPSKK